MIDFGRVKRKDEKGMRSCGLISENMTLNVLVNKSCEVAPMLMIRDA